MRYWLIKSEPITYGIEHMARDKKTSWGGVRNYQARNFMRDQMKVGDKAFFYHSNCDEPGITGIVEVSAPAHPGRDAVRQEEPLLRRRVEEGGAALGERRVQVREEDAARAPRASCASTRRSRRCGCFSPATGCRSRRSIRRSGTTSPRN